jgi:protein-S-isoprenylcysteine O-methyltransferase Ste14
MTLKKIMPTTWLLVGIVLIVLVHIVYPLKKIVPMPYNLLGIVPLMFGIGVNLVADKAFHRSSTTVKPFVESAALITTGAFRIARNPMYLGFVSVLLGICVLLGTAAPYGVVVVFALLMDMVYIREEEKMLAARFGKEWDTYRGRVRRWWP